jgi:hypothetical protein
MTRGSNGRLISELPEHSGSSVSELTPVSIEKTINLLKLVASSNRLPCLVFEHTEENAFNSFCQIIQYLTEKSDIMYANKNALAYEASVVIDKYNNINEALKEKYDEAQRKADRKADKRGVKGDIKRSDITSSEAMAQYNEPKKKATIEILSLIKKHIFRAVHKMVNRAGMSETDLRYYDILPAEVSDDIIVAFKKLFLRETTDNTIAFDGKSIDTRELTHIVPELSDMIESYRYHMKLYSDIDKISGYPATLTYLSTNSKTNFITGASVLYSKFNKLLSNIGDDNEKKRMIDMALAEGINVSTSQIKELIELFRRGAEFGLTCITPGLPMFIQSEIIKAINNYPNTTGIVFASTSMGIGIDYPLKSVIIKYV